MFSALKNVKQNNTAVQSKKGVSFSAIKNFHFETKQKNVFWCVFKVLFTLYCVKYYEILHVYYVFDYLSNDIIFIRKFK